MGSLTVPWILCIDLSMIFFHLPPSTFWVGNGGEQSIERLIMRITKTHCKRGHELTEDNLYTYDNKRRCKTCVRERQRTKYRKERIARNLADGYCKRGHKLNTQLRCPVCLERLYNLRMSRDQGVTL